MNRKRIAISCVAGVLSFIMIAGCGKLDPTKTVATVDGNAIEAGLVNLKAQISAASYDTYLLSYYGADMWETDETGTGQTLSDEVRQETLTEAERQYLLEEHMSDYQVALDAEDEALIDSYTSRFLADNTKEGLKALGADEKYVREMFRLMAIEAKMRAAIEATADTTVTEADLAESEEATEESIIAERQYEKYQEVVEAYLAAADITVDEAVLSTISFDQFLSIVETPAEASASVSTEE